MEATDVVRLIIITVPPPAVAEGIERSRRKICRISGSRACLAYPPHVTLRTGVIVPRVEMDRFLEEFGRTVGRWEPFPIRSRGLAHFTYTDAGERKRVFAYTIEKDPALADLNRRLLGYAEFRKSRKRSFHPHLTLAFDDLSREGLGRILRALNDGGCGLPPSVSWTCDNVCLYRLRGDRWKPLRVYAQPAARKALRPTSS